MRIGTAGLILLVSFILSGIDVSPASAIDPCYKVVEPGAGRFTNSKCILGGGTFIRAVLGNYLGELVYCAKTEVAGQGNRNDNNCKNVEAGGNYILVKVPPLACNSEEREEAMPSGGVRGIAGLPRIALSANGEAFPLSRSSGLHLFSG
jgi:hypothetical protein